MTEVTRNIPVTARFDGCFCSKECEHYHDCQSGDIMNERPRNIGWLKIDLVVSNVRTRWCCETFGMCEQEQEQRDTIADGVELETMDAKDAEALRRCTLDE